MAAPRVSDLERVPLFAGLDRESLEDVARSFTLRSYPKGAILISEGDRAEAFHVILVGKVKAFWRDEDDRQLDLTVLRPGDHYADATLNGEPAVLSSLALEPLRTASIPLPDLEQLLLRYPALAVTLLKHVVARLRRLLYVTRAYAMEDVYGRVVKVLTLYAVQKDGSLVVEPITQGEIAQRVGASREMVGRVLRDLARGGYFRVERGRVTILSTPPRHW